MNILAHLHLASLANSSIIGNAAADFVKGDPYKQYSTTIADGIMLHRRLDQLIDHLPEVKQARFLFSKDNQRVAPITLDIVWDHFLSKYWANYVEDVTVAEFNQQTQQLITKDIHLFSAEFNEFITAMWRGEWLVNYADVNYLDRVLHGMASRRPKLVQLKETFIDILQNYDQLQEIFLQFYPLLIEKARNQQL